jgi:hypothetical protein
MLFLSLVRYYLPPKTNLKNFGVKDFRTTYDNSATAITNRGMKKYNIKIIISVFGAIIL